MVFTGCVMQSNWKSGNILRCWRLIARVARLSYGQYQEIHRIVREIDQEDDGLSTGPSHTYQSQHGLTKPSDVVYTSPLVLECTELD